MKLRLEACAMLIICKLVLSFDIAAHRITEVMVAAYTPMTPDGMHLDLKVIPQYAKYLAKRNITNIMPAGSNGESLSLTLSERKALAEAWAAAACPGQRIYVHIGSESIVDSVALAKHAAGVQGISGILAMTPAYFKPTVETLHDFLAIVARAAPTMPFWFYHFPEATGVLPGSAHALFQLADKSGKIPNLMGIKFTDYNLTDFQICTQVGHPGKYNMLYGRDEQALAALELGADSVVSSTVGYAPSLRRVITFYAQGDRVAAKAAQEANAKLCNMIAAYTGDKNVQKNIMKMTGMDLGPSRLPKRDLSTEEYSDLKRKLLQEDLIDMPSDFDTILA